MLVRGGVVRQEQVDLLHELYVWAAAPVGTAQLQDQLIVLEGTARWDEYTPRLDRELVSALPVEELIAAPGKLWQPAVLVDVPHRVERPRAVREEFVVCRSRPFNSEAPSLLTKGKGLDASGVPSRRKSLHGSTPTAPW